MHGKDLLISFGPTLKVDIGFDPTFVPTQQAAPVAGVTGLDALVDSGATECCIDALLAAQLNLPMVNQRPIAGAHGARIAPIFMAQMVIPTLGITMYEEFAGVDLVAGGQLHHALLGRSFLARCTMTYDGATGAVSISSI